jgi:hypothetical protein
MMTDLEIEKLLKVRDLDENMYLYRGYNNSL